MSGLVNRTQIISRFSIFLIGEYLLLSSLISNDHVDTIDRRKTRFIFRTCNIFENSLDHMASVLRPRLFITHQMPSQFIRTLEKAFELDYQDTPVQLSQEQIVSRVRLQPPDAMLFPGKTRIDKELLMAAGEKLKMLATFSVGFDHIDINECRKRGIQIGYTPGE